eukprot:TRINITY_DN4250_c0_g1_i1.p1 TRINITY_DN4250_c0_g1~~TRINITY_DN4250_c0_g1_i1.p1  ORF type:complete len:197 (+),score=22.23 TRINITY_DN4250_c0_g1_i1:118-708(+)
MKLTLFVVCLCVSVALCCPASSSGTCVEDPAVDWGALNDVFSVDTTQPVELVSVTREEILTRAQSWVHEKVPYCQCNGAEECCGNCPYCSSYRCDCSGFVSYAWKLPHGYTTKTLPSVAKKITKAELAPGDAMLNIGSHVVLFGGWADAGKTSYYAYQEPGCHNSGPHYAYKSVVTYPFGASGTDFHPYRYNNVQA